MHIFHLTEIGEVFPPAVTPLFYGRYLATVRSDGTLVCDSHRYAIDDSKALCPGDNVMIWCSHDFYCCPTEEYELEHCPPRRG